MDLLRDRRVFGLLGEVVDDNPTEEMLQAAFAAAGLPWKYVSLAVPLGSFPAAVQSARQLGFAGLHITKPYKIDAVALMDRLTPAAAAIGAVNLVSRVDDLLVGDNTDGRGLVAAVSRSCHLPGASVVVLGAGGAARAVAIEVALAGATEVLVVSRSEQAGGSLLAALSASTRADARYEPWTATYVAPSTSRLLINATSVGMTDHDERPDVDMSALPPEAVVADVVIATRPTAFLLDATQRGLTTVAGNEMLVQQAAISFQTWTGQPPDAGVLRSALGSSISAVPSSAPA